MEAAGQNLTSVAAASKKTVSIVSLECFPALVACTILENLRVPKIPGRWKKYKTDTFLKMLVNISQNFFKVKYE